MPHRENPELDPKYREPAYRDEMRYRNVPVVRAKKEMRSKKLSVADVTTPLGRQRSGVTRRWKPKGRK